MTGIKECDSKPLVIKAERLLVIEDWKAFTKYKRNILLPRRGQLLLLTGSPPYGILTGRRPLLKISSTRPTSWLQLASPHPERCLNILWGHDALRSGMDWHLAKGCLHCLKTAISEALTSWHWLFSHDRTRRQ